MVWAQAIAQQHDFARELALAGGHYTALKEGVDEIARAEGILRGEWRATGDANHLRTAQELELKLTLLQGLLDARQANCEWFERSGAVNPGSVPRVLLRLRQALSLCESQPHVLGFPTERFRSALEHLEELVAQSRRSLADGSWQATTEGRRYAQVQHVLQASAGTAHGPQQAAPDPMAELKTACQDLAGVLERLQAMLKGVTLAPSAQAMPHVEPSTGTAPLASAQQPPEGPAHPLPRLVSPRSFKAVLSGGPSTPTRPVAATRKPAQPITASAFAPVQPTATAATRQAPVARSAPTGPGHAQPVPRGGQGNRPGRRQQRTPATVPEAYHRAEEAGRRSARPGPDARGQRPIAPQETPRTLPAQPDPVRLEPAPTLAPDPAPALPPQTSEVQAAATTHACGITATIDPAAGPREQLLATFQAVLDRLRAESERLADPMRPAAASGPAPGARWSAPLTEFLDWQQLALDGRMSASELMDRAGAYLGADHRNDAVLKLRRDLTQAADRALGSAARAAAAFARSCQGTAAHDLVHQADPQSFLSLAARCNELRQQWDAAPAHPHRPEPATRTKLFEALETLCRVLGRGPQTMLEALADADLLAQAATRSKPARSDGRGALPDALAALHRSCSDLRNGRLAQAAGLAMASMAGIQAEQAPLEPLRRRCMDMPATYAALLLGDPLPDAGGTAGNWRTSTPDLDADLRLRQQAQDAATRIGERWAELDRISLPDDAPAQVRQAVLVAMLTGIQAQRSATIAVRIVTGLHQITSGPGSAGGSERAALMRPLMDELEMHSNSISADLAQVQHALSHKAPLPGMQELAQTCAAALEDDLRLVRFNQAALETLEGLLAAREAAGRAFPQLRVGAVYIEEAAADVILGKTHAGLLGALEDRIAATAGTPAGTATARPAPGATAMPGAKAKTRGRPAHKEAGAGAQPPADRPMQALRLAILNDQALIQSKLLLAVAQRTPVPGMAAPTPQKMMANRIRAATLAGDLERHNLALAPFSSMAPHGQAYEDQIDINGKVRAELLALIEDLDRRLATASAGAAGSTS